MNSKSIHTIEEGLLEWCNNRFRSPAPITAETRVVDAYQLSQFVADIRQYLMCTESLEQSTTELQEDVIAPEGWPLNVETEDELYAVY